MRAKEFILENRGLPFPGTYEQEYSMFKRKGPRRIIAMTNEALDTPYEYNWKQVLDSDYVAIADLSDGSTLKIEFTEVNRGETLVGFERNGKIELTNEGDAFRIFATVMSAIKDYVEKFQPNKIIFSALKIDFKNDDVISYASRAKLYKRLVQMYASKLGYSPTIIDDPNKSAVDFILKKIKKPKVNEVADNPYPYRPNIKTPSKRIYRFETDDGLLYRVQVFNRQSADNIGEITNDLEIHFDQTDKETGQPNSSITGTGDALRVFATVADILQKEVAQQNPTGLIITSKADDPSRVKLYRTLARRATKVMPQFEITGERVVKDFEGTPYLTIILKSKPNNK